MHLAEGNGLLCQPERKGKTDFKVGSFPTTGTSILQLPVGSTMNPIAALHYHLSSTNVVD